MKLFLALGAFLTLLAHDSLSFQDLSSSEQISVSQSEQHPVEHLTAHANSEAETSESSEETEDSESDSKLLNLLSLHFLGANIILDFSHLSQLKVTPFLKRHLKPPRFFS